TESDTSTDKATLAAKPNRRAWIVTVLMFAALFPAVLYFWSFQSGAPSVADARFDIQVTGMPGPFNIAISPDGRRVIYVAAASGNVNALWVRSISSLEARMLPGTEGARFADWSPDSRFIVFATLRELKKIEAIGGPPQTLTALASTEFRRSSWNRDGTIVFANGVLRRVSASAGEAEAITELDRSLGEVYHAVPWFLPDGRHFLYHAWSTKPENRAIYIGSLDSKARTRLMVSESKAIYSPPGFLLFLSAQTLMARPFDANRLEFTGEAVPLVENIAYDVAQG